MTIQEPLRFVFFGYSVWLELEQFDEDLDSVLHTASKELNVHAIPAPHVTVVYGVSHLPEWEARKRFQEVVLERIPSWPPLKHKGFLTDVELDGIDGGQMNMSWMEISHESSDEHEILADLIFQAFHQIDETVHRNRPWTPHTSIVYDNPRPEPISPEYLLSLIERYPTLAKERQVKAIGLWKTAGTINCWKCVDRITFDGTEEPLSDASNESSTTLY